MLAAMTFPIVLLTVALAFAAFVWSSSEHEQQRAADAAAVRAAATAFLGVDFPYQKLPGVTTPVTYPDVQTIAAAAGETAPSLQPCGTVGLPPTADMVPTGVTLPVDCSAVGPFAPPLPLGVPDASWDVACSTARDAMGEGQAPYAIRYYEGDDDPQPSCTADSNGTARIQVKLATGSPLVGFGQHVTDPATGALDPTVAPQAATVQAALAAFGIHLDTSLPSLLCPEVSVKVQQPVREPVFDNFTTPNGRATARRIVKNAVIVPVYQGQTITPVPADVVSAASGEGVDVPNDVTGQTVNVPPQNLNALLLAAQQQLLTLLDEIDAISDAAIRAANVSVDQLNGVYRGVNPDEGPEPPPLPATGPLQGLRITQCLRESLTQIYDPPTGDAPTVDEVLAKAAADGEQVIAVQVGVTKASCTEPGAIETVDEPTPTDECIKAATTPQYDPTTGFYEVPFFDATPVLVQDVGSLNYQAVPVHASQASGAFRGSLVRATDDERYDPDAVQPVPTPACLQTLPPDEDTVCGILNSLPPTPTVTPPVPLPTVTTEPPPTLPVPSESSSPSPTPTESPSPTPSPSSTCILLPPLCGGL